MGVVIPQTVPASEDRASGAQIIDGGLRFDYNKQYYLKRTPSTNGSLTTWTWSGWIKRIRLSNHDVFGHVSGNFGQTQHRFGFNGSDALFFLHRESASTTTELVTSNIFRDTSAWYHFVVVWDTTNATAADRARIYVNGTRVTSFSTQTNPSPSKQGYINSTSYEIGIGVAPTNVSDGTYNSAYFSNFYLIDGQALDPSYFGFTDPLTNTWRPKKLSSSVAFGTNGFYLPLDGNTPIGQDQSGRGNNWTPVNFGGSNTIEKATGALPILNTDGGGKVARVGVRTDSNASSLVLALPLVGNANDVSNRINSGSSTKTVTVTNAVASSTQSNFYGGSYYFDGTNDYITITNSSDFNYTTSQSFTVEMWLYGMNSGRNFPVGSTAYNSGTSDYSGGIRIDWSPGTNFVFQVGTGSVIGTNVTTNTWHHVAYVYDAVAQTSKLYVDGVQNGSTTSGTQSLTNAGNLLLGVQGSDLILDYQGYLQDLRIYKGLAKYTQNFIPASTDPDILPDTPSGVAYSSNVALVPSTDGAVAFDGSGDYLTAGSSSDYDPGSGSFTVEFFLYSPATPSGNQRIVQYYYSASPYYGWTIDLDTSNRIAWFADGYTQITTPAITSGKWIHIAWVKNGSSNIIYVDGINSGSYTQSTINSPGGAQGGILAIGALAGSSYSQYFNGFISNVQVVKGTALYTSNFTPPTAPISSVANTKLLCCKSNSSATAFDVSPGAITPNGNVVASNFNPFNTNINTQRGQESGYCTWNPLDNGGVTLSNGNLDGSATVAWKNVRGTMTFPPSGKWYYEVTWGGSALGGMGIAAANKNLTDQSTGTFVSYNEDGRFYKDGPTIITTVSTYTSSDVIGVAFNCDTNSVTFYKNGVSQGSLTPTTGVSYFPWVSYYNASTSANFGQKPFKFPPPAGFQPLALANLPRPTIVRPDKFVGIVTYSGNSSTQTIRGLNFKPDLVYIKTRSHAVNPFMYDTVRGATKILNTATADPEITVSDSLTQFNSDGFTLGADAGSNIVNVSSRPYVAWCWKAGGSGGGYSFWKDDIGYSTAAAAGLTAGTITPTGASVNTKSGFSIISWTGNSTFNATVAHGLGVVPKLRITKNRTTGSTNWPVHTNVIDGSLDFFFLNTTAAKGNSGENADTSSVFYIYGDPAYGASANNYISYCWAEIPGFSKFGIYTGNGSSDGPVVITGMRPRIILLKNYTASSTNNWVIYDTERNKFNETNLQLWPNSANGGNTYEATSTNVPIDVLSNGFKIRSTGGDVNTNNNTYIYAAWAEAPAQNLFGGQSNAR